MGRKKKSDTIVSAQFIASIQPGQKYKSASGQIVSAVAEQIPGWWAVEYPDKTLLLEAASSLTHLTTSEA